MLYLLCNSWVTSQYLKHSKNWSNINKQTLAPTPSPIPLPPGEKIQLKPVQLVLLTYHGVGFNFKSYSSTTKLLLLVSISTNPPRSSLYRLIIQWFAFLSLLSYSILMLRPYSITTLLTYLLKCRRIFFYAVVWWTACIVIRFWATVCQNLCQNQFISVISVSIMIACPVRPTVPLDQCTGWKMTRFKLGAWV